jgi:hypothetical protein
MPRLAGPSLSRAPRHTPAPVEFRKVEGLDGLEKVAALLSAVRPHHACTAQEIADGDSYIPPATPNVRLLGQTPDMRHVYVRCCQAFFYGDPLQFSTDFVAEDASQDAFPAAVAQAVDWCHGLGARTVFHWHNTTQAWQAAHLEAEGWVAGQRNPVTSAVPGRFPAELAAPALRALEEDGLAVVSFEAFLADRSGDAEYSAWRLDMDLMADVPLPSPWKDTPFEQWREANEKDRRHWPWHWLALDGGEPVAQTQIYRNQVHPRLAATGLTGTRRGYRRRGIARALKLLSMAAAFDAGVEEVFTDNEESNPMLGLNLELGFEPKFATVEYRLALPA